MHFWIANPNISGGKKNTSDIKEMSLSMLKYMAKNYNSTRKMGCFYKLFCTYFTQEVIPISQNNK